MAAKVVQATEEVTLVMRQTAHQLFAHLADLLTPHENGRKKRLQQVTVTKIETFLTTFKTYNEVADDASLAKVIEQGQNILRGADLKALRSNDGLRDGIQADAAKIAASLNTLVKECPARMIVFEDE
jgi:hypothetical protein